MKTLNKIKILIDIIKLNFLIKIKIKPPASIKFLYRKLYKIINDDIGFIYYNKNTIFCCEFMPEQKCSRILWVYTEKQNKALYKLSFEAYNKFKIKYGFAPESAHWYRIKKGKEGSININKFFRVVKK